MRPGARRTRASARRGKTMASSIQGCEATRLAAVGSTSQARCAPGHAARRQEAAGSVRATSPTAPSRTIRMRSASGGLASGFRQTAMAHLVPGRAVGYRAMPEAADPPRGPRVAAQAELELRSLRCGGCVVLTDASLADEAKHLGLLEPGGLARLLARAEPGPRGRARTGCVALADSRRLLFRPARHGGLLAGAWGDRWITIARPFAELRIAARLLAAGAPVVRPALVAGERRLGFWRTAVATWYEPRTLDAGAFLAGAPGAARVVRAAAAAGAALRRFHDAGGRHRDLHARNLLLREDASGAAALLVDLDRVRRGAPPPASARFAEMMRLYRSLAKRGLVEAVGARGCAAFLRAYTGADRSLRGALLRHLPRERLRLALHGIGYRWAARRSRGWPSDRDAEVEGGR